MDNINDAISKIMSDPEALSQVQSLGKALGINANDQAESPPPPPTQDDSAVPTEMIAKISKMMPLFSKLSKEDDTTRLLSALRPFLSEEKCRKLDSAKKMLQFMKLIPLLKDSGLIDLGIF